MDEGEATIYAWAVLSQAEPVSLPQTSCKNASSVTAGPAARIICLPLNGGQQQEHKYAAPCLGLSILEVSS